MVEIQKYQVGILGKPGALAQVLKGTLERCFADIGIDTALLSVMNETEAASRNPKFPFVGVFIGYADADNRNHKILSDLIEDSSVIIPCVTDLTSIKSKLPKCLHPINGFKLTEEDTHLDKLCALILENFRLLRSDRRLFISYKRNDTQRIAIQLYEMLDAQGFDVFLDTRSVPPGKEFQSILWHRMADSDVVVLLDSPGFRGGYWTREELAQANATNVQILHILWPGVAPDPESALSEFRQLEGNSFATLQHTGTEALLAMDCATAIGIAVEALRARALAARHRYLVDNFCELARSLGKNPAVQTNRFISLQISPGNMIAVVPTIGVPNATGYEEVHRVTTDLHPDYKQTWLLYDERGILEIWKRHIDWLNEHLPISAVRVSMCATRIKEA